ncbi:hypothetical protein [Bacteroides sp.]|uniref:hypothetical protein n=1 Tax=Bacteroides sp. TaxID=29523 RepID=UPI00258A768E|nr:hypothetical protein [Bacteroides sp.]
MGKITIFSKLIINMFIGVVLAQFLGVPEAYGAIGGAVVPLAVGAFMPAGSLCEGVFTEIWTGELVKQLRGGLTASWLDGVSDYSAAVNNEVVHLVDVGGDPDVLINNTTYPIATQELEDGDIALGLDKFQTKKTAVSDDTLFALSYDKIGSVIERHGEAITIAKFKKAAHAVAPQSDTDTTPVIPTSGEAGADGRKKLVRADIIALKRRLDAKGYPAVGRRLVLCSDHVNDLLEEDQKFRDQYYNYTSGKIANMYGFEVYEFENCPFYTKEGTKVAFKTTPGGTDHQASFCFYTKRLFRAQGSTKMYYRDAATNPDNQANEVNFRHYYVVLPKKNEAIGAIYSWDGSTSQTKGTETTNDQNWAEARRAAALDEESLIDEGQAGAQAEDPNGELQE